MKKDYLESGTMADTADLVVLGAYYGTGSKGGMKSTFLMGCFNEKTKKWHTVTKVANGYTLFLYYIFLENRKSIKHKNVLLILSFDDKTLEKLQKSIAMVEIKKKQSAVPDWLVINKSLVPDFIVKSPENSPVWELTGAEFSQSDKHTADGISIRFPRVTRQRNDKSWKEATSLQRLRKLFDTSKQKSDIAKDEDDDDDGEEPMEVDEAPAMPKTSPKRKLAVKKSKKPANSDEDESEDEDEEIKVVKKKKADDAGSLPNVFEDMTFCIMPDVPQIKELNRYILA